MQTLHMQPYIVTADQVNSCLSDLLSVADTGRKTAFVDRNAGCISREKASKNTAKKQCCECHQAQLSASKPGQLLTLSFVRCFRYMCHHKFYEIG